MTRAFTTLTRKSASLMTMLALVFGGVGFAAHAPIAQAVEHDVTVTITKFIDGEQATSETADGLSFPMNATWNADNIGAGSGSYTLDPEDYQTQTVAMTHGADYSTSEDLTGENVGASCDAEEPYMLVGYTTGDTFEEAEGGTPSLTPPAFTDIQTDKHVIVWNEDCTEPPAPESVQVTIMKYLDGEQATAESADSTTFNMSSTWNDAEEGAGSGTYTLSAGSDPAYQAQTTEHAPGSDYSTSEMFDAETVGASCDAGTTYALQGYTTGTSVSEAESAEATTTAPALTDMQEDQYIIVWNETCDGEGGGDGDIGGDVEGEGELEVSSIETVDSSGTADGSYENGWVYVFNVTLPTDETDVAMQFSDWTSGDETMAVANNIRISSEQADNDGETITVTAADTYTDDLHIVEDLDAGTPGIQIEVMVEVRIPVGTENGSYTTSYGVRSQ